MAVNYGLGGFEQGSAFFAAYNNNSQTIGISTQNVSVAVRTYTNVNLGQDAGDFSSNFHLVEQTLGKFVVKTDGVFLVSYNMTTGDPSNNTIQAYISKNNLTNYARTQF